MQNKDNISESGSISEALGPKVSWPVRVWRFYIDGFKSMTIGKYLWALILVKLAILFLVFKLFFFPDFLSTNYDTDAERAEAVRHNLTSPKEK